MNINVIGDGVVLKYDIDAINTLVKNWWLLYVVKIEGI